MLRIAVCDDNSAFLMHMYQMISDEFSKHFDGSFEIRDYLSGELLLKEHKVCPYDVVFLDIDMPQMSGFDLAKEFFAEGKECYIIFVTSHNELVYDSFYFRPLNFITKGNDDMMREKLRSVVSQLYWQMKQDRKIILEDKENGRISVNLKEILYIESNKHYVIYHLAKYDRTVQLRDNIGELEKRLAEFDFVRIHKKYLVNLSHIFNVDKGNDEIIFKQGFRLPMSRNFKSAVDEKLTHYLRRTR
jgi:DNA-binding LytR/AlgR family response regulator